MKRNVTVLSLVMIAVTVLTAAAVAFAAENEGGQVQEKVTLCHKGHTITVGPPALAAHERHGDTEGACTTDPATPESPEDTTMPDTTMPDTTMMDTTMPDATTTETAAASQYEGGQDKVTICHKGHTITVGAPALAAHMLHHDDTEGACPTQDIDSTERSDEVAGTGDDLYGDSAADELNGSPDADFLQAGRGPDRMFGSADNDYIDGVDGIPGNDELDGGGGIDHCVGDEGDTFENCEGDVVEVPVP